MGRRSDHSRSELQDMVMESARAIIAQDGLRALTTRRIAKEIGYSVGTLYQLYGNLDSLILHANIRTLAALLQACQSIDPSLPPQDVLSELADRYLGFTESHPKLWNALFEHELPRQVQRPELYDDLITKLLGLAVEPLRAIIRHDDAEVWHHAQVLWSSLYGIGSLSTSDKLIETESPRKMAASLVINYVAGLRLGQGIR